MSLTLSLGSMARQAAPVQANRQAFWTSYSGSLAQEAAPIAELGTSPTCFGYQLHIGLSLSAVCRPSLSLGMVPRHRNGLALHAPIWHGYQVGNGPGLASAWSGMCAGLDSVWGAWHLGTGMGLALLQLGMGISRASAPAWQQHLCRLGLSLGWDSLITVR